ncbi:MAG: carboxypeptidase regulatory-like domain-containing protein [Candidatus Poseidoniales archaeon]|nr:MAG: carboxypeptidase regulatory-like domain-containing protein [Candidatus Poseidoniales archaeon]
MSEGAEDDATYLDEMTDETPMLFASSKAVLTIEDPNLHPIGKATAVFLLFTCMLGFLNGLDYASPDDGLVRPDEFVYRLALTAPDDTATFTGTVVDEAGQPMVNATVYLSWLDDASSMWVSEENVTDESGYFSFEQLDPGLIRVDIIVHRNDHRDVYSNRVLLSPPALIEPIGFTSIDFEFPSEQTFAEEPCEGTTEACEIRTVDRTPSQQDHPLMDSSAQAVYVLVGFAFMGLSLIAAGFSVWALKSGSIVLLRTSSVVAFFTVGHYWSACIFGLLAFVLTFAIPRRRIPML